MTSPVTDPKKFETWEDAFRYPIPAVRKFEQQLRQNVDENNDKISSWLGANYRGLLRNAGQVIEMDENLHQVETTLGKIGRRCNAGAFNNIFTNSEKYNFELRARDQDDYIFTMRLSVLRSFPHVTSRLLRTNSSSLLCAKILVIFRLLQKSLPTLPNPPPVLESLQRQSATLHRRLLRRIDGNFSNENLNLDTLVDNMCAFSVVTSSTPTDVLRHFHHVRLEKLISQLQVGLGENDLVIEALKFCIHTLHQSCAIFPKQLSDALLKLKARPLLQDEQVLGVSEFCLHVRGRWITEDVRNFTPWPLHNELSKTEAEKLLNVWATTALNSCLQGMQTALSGEENFEAIVEIRNQILETWLLSKIRTPAVHFDTVLNDLRNVSNSCMSNLVRAKIAKLVDVSSEINSMLDDFKSGSTDHCTSIWDNSTTSIDILNGTELFKNIIVDRMNGRNEFVTRIMRTHGTWAQSIYNIKLIITGMEKLRFCGNLDSFQDDETECSSRQTMICQEDPRTLLETMNEAFSFAIADFRKSLEDTISHILQSSGKDTLGKAIFMLRAFCEIFQGLSHLNREVRKTSLAESFPYSIVSPLHDYLSRTVLGVPLLKCKRSLERIPRSKKVFVRSLWEGNPPLPVQPSPSAYKFLKDLCGNMAMTGSDLWNPGATKILKAVSWEAMTNCWHDCVKQMEESEVEEKEEVIPAEAEKGGEVDDAEKHGTTKSEELASPQDLLKPGAPGLKTEKLAQLLFDALYLQNALWSRPRDGQSSSDCLSFLIMGINNKAMVDRLRKNAANYWKRTYLLFAALLV